MLAHLSSNTLTEPERRWTQHSPSWMISSWAEVFSALKKNNLVIDAEKCLWAGRLPISLLGHRLSASGVLRLPSHLAAEQHFPQPGTPFLGLWIPAYTPGRRSDQSGVLQQHWTVHVQCLYTELGTRAFFALSRFCAREREAK